MCLGDSDALDGEGGSGRVTEVTSVCSICLEAVMISGRRSIAKLQCGHEFHLDCIGSAFNAKGMMQCPNCRNVEKGNWLYGNGYCFLPAFNMDEWAHDENFYDTNYLEMPYQVHWCPVSTIRRVTTSSENGDSFPSVAFQSHVGHHAIFTDLPSISVFAHPCPHLSGFHQVRQTSPPTLHADGISDTSLYYHQWSQVDLTEIPSPLSLLSNASLFHGWEHYRSTFSHPREIAMDFVQASVYHAASNNTRLEDGGPPRAGSLFSSFIGRHGFPISPVLSHTTSSDRPHPNTPDRHRPANNTSSEHLTSYTNPWRSRNSTILPFASQPSYSSFYIYPPPVSFNTGIPLIPFTGFWRTISQTRNDIPSYGSNGVRSYI